VILLEGKNVTKRFGGLFAVNNVDFHIEKGEILGLIGPNGAGKTTLFNLIAGVYEPTTGKIVFESKVINGLKPHQICHAGIGRTFQIVKTFESMTITENVMVGARFGKSDKIIDTRDYRDLVLGAIDFVGLTARKDAICTNLNIGERKKVELARTLATQPKLLLLDEVMAGLNSKETEEVMRLIRLLRDGKGMTILLIEHIMKAVMGVSERVIVLHHGEKLIEGPPEVVVRDEAVVNAYLGERIA